MLSSLSIQDIVLIDRLDFHCGPGLSVLTGETGAGKSILLDALGLALGSRADSALIRQGANQGSVTVNGSTVSFAGVANPSYTYYDSWKSNFGWNGGGGVSFGLGDKVDLFFESRMIADKTNTDKGFVPIIGGFTWSF